MKREIIELNKYRKEKMTAEKKTKVYRLYDYLKANAVGYENKKTAKEIICALPEIVRTRQDVEDLIQKIRISFDRKVGSTISGYWLACTDDSVKWSTYITNQALSKMEVAVRAGVDVNVIYKKLNEIREKENSTLDKQQRFTFSPNEESEIRRYSDDLRSQG